MKKFIVLITFMVIFMSTKTYADLYINEKNNNTFDSKIGAWYNIWMNPNKAGKRAENWELSRYTAKYYEGGQLKDGFYDNNRDGVIDYQKEQMKESGIEFLLIDWTPNYSAGSSYTTALKLFKKHDIPLAFAIGGPLFENNDIYEMNNQANKIYLNFYENYKTKYFSPEGSDKPLLVVYNSYDNVNGVIYDPYWTDARFTIGRATGRVEDNSSTLERYYWDKCNGGWWGWMQQNERIGSDVMIVSPGANTVKSDILSGRFIPRSVQRESWNNIKQRGKTLTYMNQWISAIKNNPKHIIIASWNDYNEETHIEPSTPFTTSNPLIHEDSRTGDSWNDATGKHDPFLYVKITKAYSVLRNTSENKSRLLENYYYKDQSSPNVFRVSNGELVKINSMSQIKSGYPIIELPDDWLSQIIYNINKGVGATYINSHSKLCS